MTHPTDDDATQQTRAASTSATESPRVAEQTGDLTRGTARETSEGRASRRRPSRTAATPADRHE